jgi:hypothetical protein
MNLRDQLAQGQASLTRAGEVRPGTTADLPYVITDDRGEPVEAVSAFLRDLMLGDCRPATCRSYAHDLLRWLRLLAAVGVGWEQAARSEVALLVAWMRNAPNPQRRRHDPGLCGTVNLKTGKPYPATTSSLYCAVNARRRALSGTSGSGRSCSPVTRPASPATRARSSTVTVISGISPSPPSGG